MAACDSSGKKAWVLLWYQARGMRSQAVRGAAWERPVREIVRVSFFACDRVDLSLDLLFLRRSSERTVCAAVVEEDVCVCACVRLGLVLRVGFRDCDFVLVALAGA
jgi:hypothetical protein